VHGNHEVDHPPASRNINAPAACLSALLCSLLVSPLCRRSVYAVPVRHDTFGLGLVFLTVGDYSVSATENALINTLETPPAVA
jgi:hypothetical protein